MALCYTTHCHSSDSLTVTFMLLALTLGSISATVNSHSHSIASVQQSPRVPPVSNDVRKSITSPRFGGGGAACARCGKTVYANELMHYKATVLHPHCLSQQVKEDEAKVHAHFI